MRVVRDTSRWNFEFGEARLYHDMASAMHELGAARVTVFAVSQFADRPTGSQAFVTTVEESARNAGLRVERLMVKNGDVSATFGPARGLGEP